MFGKKDKKVKSSGQLAEDKAALYLKKNKFKVIDRNWRNRFCEIDIVAMKKNRVYFVELKYRQNIHHGSGLDYITDKKLQQMEYAANFWVTTNKFDGDYCLAAIELEGEDYKIGRFIEI